MSDENEKMGADVDAYIDENLRRVFAALENEDVPDRFKKLLADLHAQEEQGAKDDPK